MVTLSAAERAVLYALTERAGMPVMHIADRVGLEGSGVYRSGLVAGWCKALEGKGFVAKDGDIKPYCWLRTAAGTAVLEDAG